MISRVILVSAFLVLAPPLPAQQWNAAEALELVRRGTERRVEVEADTGLKSYRTRAHGFVFFLGQVGQGLTEPPRLIKADELAVEVYWEAPNRSKQVILGWRDGSWLPTDIDYHRDHLGIVTNNFGQIIRIGEGDEVRDAIHPLSKAGLDAYDFALRDSVRVRSGTRDVTVYEVQVRPRSFQRPLIVGKLYLDVNTAELVRMRFSFTPLSYLDKQVEDITIVLENALYEGRYWLPFHQEIEIRRRTNWLDFPARGIIRGRWELGEYELNAVLPPGSFAGPQIGGLTAPRDTGHMWEQPLEAAIADVAAPVNQQDMEAVRVEVERIAGGKALDGLSSRRLAAGSVSDLVHVNRVQGLALGFGGTVGFGGSRLQLRPGVGYGTSDKRFTGGLSLTMGTGSTQLSAGVTRRVRDLSDLPVITPAVNSLLAQEAGKDYGDYVLVDAAGVGLRHRLSGRTAVSLEAAVEKSRSVAVSATPSHGEYRVNPPLGAGTYRIGLVRLERSSGGIALQRDLQGALTLEIGEGPTEYYRTTIETRWVTGLAGGQILARSYLGASGEGLPAYRSFVIGGRGTLLGEPYRAFGGGCVALAHLEWRFEAPFPAIRLGSFASTGRTITLAPFIAAGWSDRAVAGTPWRETDGMRPVVGLAVEWFMRLIRLEAGYAPRRGEIGVTVDINRDWWGIL